MTKRKMAAVLSKVAKLLKRKDRWIRGAFAKDIITGQYYSNGGEVPEGQGAYCAVGGIERVLATEGLMDERSSVLNYVSGVVRRRHGLSSVIVFNDSSSFGGQAVVVKLFERAACEARKERRRGK